MRGAQLHVAVWIAMLLAASAGQAQKYQPTTTGGVTDRFGKVITGAQAQVSSKEIHPISPAVKNDAGVDAATFLTPNTDDVETGAKGFSPAERPRMLLVAGNPSQADFALPVEPGTQSVPTIADQESLKTVDETIVGIKLLKANRGAFAQPLKIFIPADCTGCAVMHGPFYEGQNAREVFFYVKVPVSPALIPGVKVEMGDLKVRALVVEKSYLPFHRVGDAIVFDLPVAPRARSSTLEVQTSLNWPGLTVRIEHAFKDRRAGPYATGPWPAVQRQAALNLEFGLREAVRDLGLDREVCDRNLGRIHLMGFDTNYPLGHEDFPPHIHMILRWPHFAGSQAPHFYLSKDGLLKGNVKVTIDGLPDIAETAFLPGAPVPAIDYLGETVYDLIENSDGTLTLQRPDAGECVLRPLRVHNNGFASGTKVACTTGQTSSVAATDDVEAGVLSVSINGKPTETYKYDPDTAVLLSAKPALMDTGSAVCTLGAAEQMKH